MQEAKTNGDNSPIKQHSGSGDNVEGDKITNNYNHSNPHTVPKMLTRSGQESLLNYVVQESLVEKIEKDLLSHSIVWIQGFGGMGKSALASHYFNLHHHRYEYVAMFKVGLDIASNFATNLKDPLQLPFGSARELFGVAINRLSNLDGKKLLIVDDVQNLKEQLPLLEEIIKLRHSGFEIIFTSREQYDSIEPMVLEGLSIQKARELFTIHYPSDEIEKIDKIIHYLDFHTYFIKLTAIALKKQPHTVTLESIYHDFETKRLGEMSSGDQESFYDLLDRLFDNKTLLEDETNLLFLKRLAIFPSTQISFEELKTLLFYSEEVLEEMLNRLTSHGWIIQTADGYKLHQILKRYLLERYNVEFGQISQTVKFLTQMLERMNQLFDASTKEIESMEDIVQTRELNLRYLYLSSQIPHILANNLTPDISWLLVHQAHGYQNYGEYSKALKLRIVIKNIYEHIHGKEHRETATSYNNIGAVYYLKKEYDKALEFYQKSLAIYEEVLGLRHPDTAQNYNNIGEVYRAKGEYDKALEFFQKSLVIREEVLGKKHPSTATSYNSIAILYYNMQNYPESARYMQKAVDIRERVLPANHPYLIGSKEALATIKAKL